MIIINNNVCKHRHYHNEIMEKCSLKPNSLCQDIDCPQRHIIITSCKKVEGGLKDEFELKFDITKGMDEYREQVIHGFVDDSFKTFLKAPPLIDN